jgi:rhamnose transport system permease protein
MDASRRTPAARPVAARARSLLLGRDAAVIVLLVAVWLIGSVSVDNFAKPNTVYFLLLDVLPIVLIALPMTMVVIAAEIDLSVASMLGLSSVIVGVLFQHGWPVWAAAVVALGIGAVGGALNGFLVATVGLPSLAVTVATLALFRGIAVGLLGTKAVTGFPESYKDLASDRLFGPGTAIPAVLLVFVVLAIGFGVLLHFTAFGRATYAVGMSAETSRFSGVNVRAVKFWLFVATGAVSALAGIYWTLRYGSARGDNAVGLELTVVAAVLVGGVSIFGGRGAIPGVIAGALLIGALRAVLRLADVSADAINIATGVVLIASVVFPRILSGVRGRRRRSRRRGLEPEPSLE